MSSFFSLKAAEFAETTPRDRSRVQVVLFPLPKRDGFVFGLVVIHKHKPSEAIPVPVIEEHLENLAEQFDENTHPQHRFEQFLNNLNEQLAAEVRKGSWQTPIGNLSAIIGIACENRMYLSGTGELTALFLHRKPTTQRYQVFNLARNIHTEQALPTWEKAFAVVLDGDLHKGDVLCLSNQDLQRTLPADELNSVLATLPPKSATAKIRQYFPAATNLSLLLIKAQDTETPVVTEQAQPLSEISVEQLGQTRETTERLLGDQLPALTFLKNIFRKRNPSSHESGLIKKPKSKLFHLARRASFTLATVTGKLLVKGGHLLKSLLNKAKKRSPEAINHPKEALDTASVDKIPWIKRLPTTSKYLLLGAFCLLLVFSISITVLLNSKANSRQQKAYLAQISEIETRIDQGTEALTYNNKEAARTLYQEANQLISTLPTETDEERQTAERLRLELATGFDVLRQAVRIPTPPILGERSGSSKNQALVKEGANLYVFGDDKQVYQLDRSTKKLTQVETTDGEIGTPQETTTNTETILFTDDRPGISIYDPEAKTLKITNLAPDEGSKWQDLQLYNGRLYVLETNDDGQILRFNQAGTGFGSKANWIQSKTANLSDATDFAIDGSIFILMKDGQILHFASGSELGWTPGFIEPQLSQPTDIWTDLESEYVYVLEPATQRVVVLNKEDGSLKTQYESEAFGNLTDFLVDETTKTIYLLDTNNLYAITASHL